MINDRIFNILKNVSSKNQGNIIYETNSCSLEGGNGAETKEDISL